MIRNPLIDVLQKNKYLRSEAEVREFDRALGALAASPQSGDLPALHAVFTDETQQPEVMYGLVHLVESFEMKSQLTAFVEALPRMIVDAPEWAKSLIYRILNDAPSRSCYKNLLHAASPVAQKAAKGVLSKIGQEDTEFSSRIRELVS